MFVASFFLSLTVDRRPSDREVTVSQTCVIPGGSLTVIRSRATPAGQDIEIMICPKILSSIIVVGVLALFSNLISDTHLPRSQQEIIPNA